MTTTLRLASAASFAALLAYSVETRTWTHREASEFEKGTIEGLALSTAGRLTLAPEWKELYDAETAQLWAVAAGGGKVYAAGMEGKVFVLEQGKTRLLATLEGGTVYALTVSNGVLFAAVSPEAKIYRIDASGKAAAAATLNAKYVWALAPAPNGGLYAATGEPGQVWQIGNSGDSRLLFDAEEAHVRSLAVD